MYSKFVKRFLDCFLATLAFIVLLPVLLVVYILVCIFMGTPAIFKQERVGKDEKIFTMYKFRTMTNKTDENGVLLPDEQRKTKFGSFLRSTSIDELPELINIIKGDLSIVGPRPLLVEYLPYYTEEERLRHTVRGGLTQPEVLYDKVFPTWDEQLQYEVEYAKNVTFKTDVKIIFKTIQIIFGRIEKNYGEQTRKTLIEERREKVLYDGKVEVK